MEFMDHVANPWKAVDGTRVYHPSFWANCRKWNKQAAKTGVIRTVFPSMCDPFEDYPGQIKDHNECSLWINESKDVPIESQVMSGRSDFRFREAGYRPLSMNDLRRQLFSLIDECPNLLFLLLTKRPGNVPGMWPLNRDVNDTHATTVYFDNVAIVASISDQQSADERVPDLLKCRGLVKYLGVSAEPLVSEIDLDAVADDCSNTDCGSAWIDFAIVGGESGPKARPCNVEDIRSLIAQCRAAEVPCFVKQLGQSVIVRASEDFNNFGYVDSNHNDDLEGHYWLRLRDPKGGDPEEWPEDLRVRQLPWRKDV